MVMRTAIISTFFCVIVSNSSYAIPANAHIAAETWQCNSNYKKKDQQCEKTSASETQLIAEKIAIAISLEIAERYKEALNIYLPLAKSGNVGAQFNLAGMYGRGEGVLVDYKRAFSWYEKAALQGHAMSQYYLGVLYMKGLGAFKDPKKGFYWIEQSAKQGYKYAQSHLGILYAAGASIGKDHNKAIVWHRKAAEHGVVTSQYYIAWYYCIGFEAAPKNLHTCARWAKKAQQNGSEKASKLWERYELWKYF